MLEYVRGILKEQGLSLSEVARRMGVNRQTVYNELGNDMRLSTLLRIADAMGCKVGFVGRDRKFVEFTADDLKK